MAGSKRSILRSAAVGAGAGIVATVAMSAVMLGARMIGMRAQLPPARIAEEAVGAVANRPPDQGEEGAVATIAHVGFGALGGAIFGGLAGSLRAAPVAAALGTLFGSGVWLVSYQGWIPALGIMPPATRDHPERVGTMVVAHCVYGAVLGFLTYRLRGLASG